MKTVYENSMVAHIWANQSQEHARSNNGQLYFNGADLFSYGSHYLLGRIMPGGVVLLNGLQRSRTTGKHQNYAARACSHLTRITVPNLTELSNLLCEPAPLRRYVAANCADLSQAAGEYLLGLAKVKDPAASFARMVRDAEKAAEKKKAADQATERKERLDYAARVSKMAKNEKELVKGLANVMGGGDSALAKQATKLHHCHRAAKAAKREKQAADVWRVLKLVKAEIALREKQNARKNANNARRYFINEFRGRAKELRAANDSGKLFGYYPAQQLGDMAKHLAGFARLRLVAPKFEAIAAGIEAVRPAILDAENAAREIAERAALAAWYNGERGAQPPRRYGSAALLRAVRVTRDADGNISGGTLETSQGADVPLLHALRAFRFIKLCKERGEAWQRNGHSLRVGHFAIDSVDTSGNFRAGCHRIEWPEIERLAVALGVFEETASDSALEETTAAA